MVRKAIGILTVLALVTALAPPGAAQTPIDGAVGALRINEVLYNPSGAESGAEAVELVNPTPLPVDLTGWALSDDDAFCNPPNDAVALNGTIAPGGVLVVTIPASPRCVTLSNSGDAVRLHDPSGAVVDSVCWGDDCSDNSGAAEAPAPVEDGVSVQRCLLANPDGSLAHDAAGGAAWRAAAPTLGAHNDACLD